MFSLQSIRRVQIAAMIIGVFILPIAHSNMAAAFHETTRIASVTDRYTDSPPIATDGQTVVWIGPLLQPGGEYALTLNGATLPERQPFVIAGLGDVPVTEFTSFDVDGDRVVWDAFTSIFLTNLSTGVTSEIVATDDLGEGELIAQLSIWEDWVVWVGRSATTAWVKGRNISATDQQIVTFAEQARQGFSPGLGALRVDDGWVAWGESYDGDPQSSLTIQVQRVDGTGPRLDFDASDARYFGTHELRDGTLIYPIAVQAAPPADVAAFRIIDLVTGAEDTVSMTHPNPRESLEDMYPHVGVMFAADGRYIFQSFILMMGTPNMGAYQQVVAYDLQTGSSFIVVDGMLRDHLVADDGVLVWVTTEPAVYAAEVSDRLPSTPRAAPQVTIPESTYYAETGHYLSYGFRAYWEGNGGLPVFGFPLTEEFREVNPDTGETYTVQYFERQRYEWHPENAGSAYEVLLGRLGAQLLIEQGRDWQDFPRADPESSHYFPETGHAIDPHFWDYWSSHGLDLGDAGVSMRESIALFGYPLSPAQLETNEDDHTVLTQYFERAVFEWHPDNSAEYRVLLRRLGAEVLAAREWYRP